MIPIFDPEITLEDKEAVAACLERGELSGRSPVVKKFEDAFAAYCGVKHAISVNSGSSAVFLALEALQLPRGSRVVVPSFGYIAVPNAVLQAGCKPVFVDVDIKNGNIDLSKLQRTLENDTIKAIVVIHTYGFPVDMEIVNAIAKEHGCAVVEDAAEAHGAFVGSQRVGSLGDLGCFSFFANKIITSGEGGMVTTNNDALADRIRGLKDQFNGTKRYYHEENGYSLCMPALSAALGLSQLGRIEDILARKRAIGERYEKKLRGVRLLRPAVNTSPVYWAFGVLVENRDELMAHLAEWGIETRPFFTAYHNNPPYMGETVLPSAEYLQNHGLYLPSSHTLTKSEQNYVIETVNNFGE